MKKMRTIVCMSVCLFMTTACQSSRSGKVYSRDAARAAQTVKLGTVEFVDEVQIEGTKSPVGAIAGGVLGGVLGSTIGGGSGQRVATAGGALVGAGAGALAEERITRKDGLEITVKLDDGTSVSIVQENDVPFAAGDRVRVLTAPDGTARVRK